MALTLETQHLVANIITQQIRSVRETEFQKHVLAQEKSFLPVNVFQRIDVRRRMQIDTLDLVAFFRENYIVVSEADCYMLVKQMDSNNDGLLNLADLIRILCPAKYTTSVNIKAARKHAYYAQQEAALPHAIEFAVV
jgi:Ca2+-binding EF-hand superfamily protein